MKLHRSQILQMSLLAFLFGTGVAGFFGPAQARILFFSALILAIVLMTTFWKVRLLWLFAGILLAFTFGVWNWHNFTPVSDSGNIAFYNGSKIVEWQGVVTEEPDVREGKVNLTISAKKMVQPKNIEISGKVLITLSRFPEYRYGDLLSIQGKLEEPGADEDFSYRDYLAKDRIYSLSGYPKVEKLGSNRANFIKSKLLELKAAFVEKLSLVLPEPQNSFLAGLLVGAKRAIPKYLSDAFKTAGVSHIVAISGFNISIITRILGSLLQRKLGPRFSAAVVILVVVGFVIITGAQASVVRAAVMGVLAVLALNLGRSGFAGNVLLATAALMVLFSPLVLVFDVGFQLSFLATAGLVFLSEGMERILRFVPDHLELRASLASTLAAQVFVLPLLIYNFDQLSLVSPMVNMLVLPAIPLTMLLGFISGVAGLLWLPLSYLSAWI
ncbi:MAG: ComEC/Rec2 family competence protein, partial [bacterium]|nr:ComEC/Rec2 family competence protein [bacterium]